MVYVVVGLWVVQCLCGLVRLTGVWPGDALCVWSVHTCDCPVRMYICMYTNVRVRMNWLVRWPGGYQPARLMDQAVRSEMGAPMGSVAGRGGFQKPGGPLRGGPEPDLICSGSIYEVMQWFVLDPSYK